MNRVIILLTILALILTGCGGTPTPDVEATIAAGIAATQTAQPTNTPVPEPTDTLTPTATPTSIPTDTPEPTDTPTPEPTDIPTATPEPPTATSTNTPTSTPTNTATLMPPTATPLPTNTPLPPTPIPTDPEFGIQKAVGVWGIKLYDIKRTKVVWWFGDGEFAQGLWLIPMVELTNNSTGSATPYDSLTFVLANAQGQTFESSVFNTGARAGAAWQFQAGDILDRIDPGVTIGTTVPFDVPEDLTAVWLKVEEDPSFSIYLGDASQIERVE